MMTNKRWKDDESAPVAASEEGMAPSTTDRGARIEDRWPSLTSSERLSMLRSVSVTESIFVRAHWDELPTFARIALQMRYDVT